MDEDNSRLFICPHCGADIYLTEKFSSSGKEVTEGILTCSSCHVWYKISRGIPDLLPPELRRHDLYEAFCREHGIHYERPDTGSGSLQKYQQIDFFRRDFSAYERDIVDSNYYQALDALTFESWLDKNSEGIKNWILEIGCGTGRQSVKIARRKKKAVCLDISEEMILLAKAKVERIDAMHSIEFVIGDAECPPVRDTTFDACIVCATLHHLPDPEQAICCMSKKLATGGLFFSIDPHASKIRFLFDWLMRRWKLYDEETGDSPLIDGEKLKEWLVNAKLRTTIYYSSYFPPHFFIFLDKKASTSFLKNSDKFFNKFPMIFKFSGIIVSEGIKIDT